MLVKNIHPFVQLLARKLGMEVFDPQQFGTNFNALMRRLDQLRQLHSDYMTAMEMTEDQLVIEPEPLGNLKEDASFEEQVAAIYHGEISIVRQSRLALMDAVDALIIELNLDQHASAQLILGQKSWIRSAFALAGHPLTVFPQASPPSPRPTKRILPQSSPGDEKMIRLE